MKEKEIIVICCKCGRMKRNGEWVYVQHPFSVFVSKVVAKGISSVKFIQGKCSNCRERKSVPE